MIIQPRCRAVGLFDDEKRRTTDGCAGWHQPEREGQRLVCIVENAEKLGDEAVNALDRIYAPLW